MIYFQQKQRLKTAEWNKAALKQWKSVVADECDDDILKVIEEMDMPDDDALGKPEKPTGTYDKFDEIDYSNDYRQFKDKKEKLARGVKKAFNILWINDQGYQECTGRTRWL